MSNKIALVLPELLKDTFDPKETLKWVKRNVINTMSWGAKNFTTFQNKALWFSVSGRNHSGIVLITLDFNDTYIVTLLSTHWNIKATFEGVYNDQLAELIDAKVESEKTSN